MGGHPCSPQQKSCRWTPVLRSPWLSLPKATGPSGGRVPTPQRLVSSCGLLMVLPSRVLGEGGHRPKHPGIPPSSACWEQCSPWGLTWEGELGALEVRGAWGAAVPGPEL